MEITRKRNKASKRNIVSGVKEISEGVVFDYDAQGNIVGIDIDEASKKLDMKEIILNKLPCDVKAISV